MKAKLIIGLCAMLVLVTVVGQAEKVEEKVEVNREEVVLFDVAKIAPETLFCGENDLELTIENTQKLFIRNISVTIEPPEHIDVLGKSTQLFSFISQKDDGLKIKYRLFVDENITTGVHYFDINIGYSFLDQRQTQRFHIGVFVMNPGTPTLTPLIRVTCQPSTVSAGEMEDLNITLHNPGDLSAENVTVLLCSEAEQPIKIAGTGKRSIESIPPGGSFDVVYNIYAQFNSSSGVFPLSLSILLEEKEVFNTTIGVVVSSCPKLELLNLKNDGISVKGEVANVGNGVAKSIIVTLGEEQAYIGTLLSGESDEFELSYTGERSLDVTYFTDNGESYVLTTGIPEPEYIPKESKEPTTGEGPSVLWIYFLVFGVLVAVTIILIRIWVKKE